MQPLPGHVGNLTDAQARTLSQLKSDLESDGHLVPSRMDDPMFLRFLRARNFDLQNSKSMIIACEKWRSDSKVDDLVRTFDFTELKEVDRYYPHYYHKTDKNNRPIFFVQLDKLDTNALLSATSIDRLTQRITFENEKLLDRRLPACSRTAGHPVETCCIVIDLKNAPLTALPRFRDYLKDIIFISMDRYPECLEKVYMINAPFGFSVAWNLIKSWLPGTTASKIEMLGRNYQESLLSEIPSENLPVAFGGTCACDGGCSLSDAGPWNTPIVPTLSADKITSMLISAKSGTFSPVDRPGDGDDDTILDNYKQSIEFGPQKVNHDQARRIVLQALLSYTVNEET